MITSSLSQLRSTIVAVLALFAFTAVVFGFSFEYRNVNFDNFPRENESGYTLLLRIKNWYEHGPVALKFGLFDDSPTVEDPLVFIKDNLYSSYLPGQVFTSFAAAKLLNRAPTIAFLVTDNLFTHFSTAFVLSLLIFFFLLQIKLKARWTFCFALIPIYLEILLPGPFVLHHAFHSSEHMVILPFVLFIFLETLGEGMQTRKKVFRVLEGLVALYGLFLSWFFLAILLAVYIKRLLLKQHKRLLAESVLFWLPVGASIAFFIVQQYFLFSDMSGGAGIDSLRHVKDMFLTKSGLADVNVPPYIQIVLDKWAITTPVGIALMKPFAFLYYYHLFFKLLYGTAGFWLFIVSLLIAVGTAVRAWWQKRQKQIQPASEMVRVLSLIFIILAPPLIWTIVFRQQISYHELEFLKFSPFVAIVPFVLIPVLFSTFWPGKALTDNQVPHKWSWLFILIPIGLSLFYLSHAINNQVDFFVKAPEINREINRLVRQNTADNDIVFTTVYNRANPANVGRYDGAMYAATNKKIYQVYEPKDIYRFLSNMENTSTEYVVNILSRDPDNTRFHSLLTIVPNEKIYGNGLILYKIKKTDFLSIDQKLIGDLNERIINGDFEALPLGWQAGPKTVLKTSEAGYVGSALKIELNSTSSDGAYQAVPVQKGKTYTLIFYQKNGSTGSTYCVGTNSHGQEIKNCEDISNNFWTEYKLNFQASEDTAYIQFYTRSSGTLGDYAFIDEVSLK